MFFFRKKRETGLTFILIYLIYSFFADLLINKILTYHFKNEFLGFRLFTLVEYSLITLFLYSIISSPKFKKLIFVLSALFISYSVIDFFTSDPQTFDSTATGISSILILLYSIFFLFEKIKNPDSLFLYATPHFWLVVALIIFFSGTFFVYIFSQNNYKDPSFQASFNIINSSFGILKNLFFSIAFLLKSNPSSQNLALNKKTGI